MSQRLDRPVRLLEALASPAGDGRPIERRNLPPDNRSWFRAGVDRMVVLSRMSQPGINGRVIQPHATAAPRAVLHRMLRGRAVTVRASLHRGASPEFAADPPEMRGSPPAAGDKHAAQAD